MRGSVRSIVFFLLSASATHAAASAQTWTVDDDGPADFLSIQAAIDAASDGDLIRVSPGHYGRIDFLGKRLSVVSASGSSVTVIDGHSVHGAPAVLRMDAAGPALLEGFTIRGGTGLIGDFGIPGGWHGGAGIAVVHSALTVAHCAIVDNHGGIYGGGIGCAFGTVIIRDSVIRQNSALAGGGINGWAADIRCERVMVLDNQSTGLGAGAIDMWSRSYGIVDRLELVDVELSGNLATDAGPMWDGIYNGGEMRIHSVSAESILNAGWIEFRSDLGPSILDVSGDLSFVHGSKWFGSGMGRLSVGVHPTPAGPTADMVRVAGTLGVPHPYDESESLGLLDVTVLPDSAVSLETGPLEFLRYGHINRGFTMFGTRGLASGTVMEYSVGPSGGSPAHRLIGSIRPIASGNGSLLDSRALPAAATALSAIDLERDGHPDVCVGMASTLPGWEGQVVAIRNSGNGPDGEWLGLDGGSLTLGVAGIPVSLAAGDFGGDANADLLVALGAGELVTLASDWGMAGVPAFARSSMELAPVGIASVARNGLVGLSRAASGDSRIVVQDAASGSVSIAEFPPIASDMQCACDGRFGVGSRVRAAVANPGGTGLPIGAEGTAVFAFGQLISGASSIVVRWDGWVGGSDWSGVCDIIPCCGAFQESVGQLLSRVPCAHLEVPSVALVGRIERDCEASCVASTEDGSVCAAGCIDSGTLLVRFVPAPGLPAETVGVELLHGQSAIALADLDGDGMEDVLAAMPGIDTVAIALRSSTNRLGLLPWLPLPVGRAPSRIAAGDMDADGDADVAVLVELPEGGAAIEVYRNNRVPGTSVVALDMIGHADVGVGVPRDFLLADLSGDGRLDVVAIVSPPGSGFSPAGSTVRIFGLLEPERPCDCDLNFDSSVDGVDLGLLLSRWGASARGAREDVNRDGSVDGIDLGLLLAAWGPCP